MMQYCRQVLADRCVLENYSIRWPLQPSPYPSMYESIKRLGPPIAFQTAAEARIGDWQRTLDWAADVGASSVELNRAYTKYQPDQLAAVARRFAPTPG